MRHTAGQKEETRRRILEAAGRTFRRRGYDGAGVDGLASEVGVTSGAFYAHFRSKEAAFEAAVVAGMEDLRAGVEKYRAEHGADWVGPFAAWYLSRERREDRDGGCALYSLSPDVTRAGASVRAAYQTALAQVTGAVAAGLAGGDAAERGARATALLALLAGGVTLARAVGDTAEADRIAAAVCRATVAASLPA